MMALAIAGLGDSLPGMMALAIAGLGDFLPGMMALPIAGLRDSLPGMMASAIKGRFSTRHNGTSHKEVPCQVQQHPS